MVLGIDRPLQGLDDVAEMLAHCRLAGIGIPARERVDDRFVLAQRTGGPPWPQDRAVLKADALGFEIGEQPACGAVVGDRPDPLVKLGVEPRVPHRIPLRQPLTHPDDRAAKVAEVGGGHPLGRVTHDHLFEDHPHLLDLQRLAVGYEADPGATVWLAGDQSLLVQSDEGGPDRGPAGVQSTREVRFNQPFVWVKLATDDLVAQSPVGVGAAVGRRWRLAPRESWR